MTAKEETPQLEDGYTKIANELLDAMCRHDFGNSKGQVFAAIIRATYGWNKKADKISLSQIIEKTGLSKRTVIYTLQNLEAQKKITIIRNITNGEKNINEISIQKDYSLWNDNAITAQYENVKAKARISSAKLRQQAREDLGGSAKLINGVVQNSEIRHEEVVQNYGNRHEEHGGVVQNSNARHKKKLGVVQNSEKKVNSFAHTKDTIQKKVLETVPPTNKKCLSTLSPCDKYCWWEIGMLTRAYFLDVRSVSQNLENSLENDRKYRDRYKSFHKTLINWVKNDITWRKITPLDDLFLEIQKDDHPDKIAERQRQAREEDLRPKKTLAEQWREKKAHEHINI